MHGGAAGSGAPSGNRNALKDGYHAAAARAARRDMNRFIADMTAAVARLEVDVRERRAVEAGDPGIGGQEIGGPKVGEAGQTGAAG